MSLVTVKVLRAIDLLSKVNCVGKYRAHLLRTKKANDSVTKKLGFALCENKMLHLGVDFEQCVCVRARVPSIQDEGLITADPYVKVLVGDKVAGRTNTVYKSLAPEWNEEVLNEYPVLAGDRELRFAIIDENRDRLEDKLGEVELPLVDVGLGRTLQVKLDIEACEGCEDATGELEVVVTWTEITDEATLQKIAEETAAIEAKKRKKVRPTFLGPCDIITFETPTRKTPRPVLLLLGGKEATSN